MAYELNRGKYVLYLMAVQNLIEDNALHAKNVISKHYIF